MGNFFFATTGINVESYTLDWDTLAGKKIIFEGDSITVGVGASPSTNRWTTVLSGLVGATEINRGLSGKVLEDNFPCLPLHPIMDIEALPVRGVDEDLLVIALGVNDIGMNNGLSAAVYKTRYRSLIRKAIDQGFEPKDILIVAPFNVTTAGYSNYLGSCDVVTPANDTRFAEYTAASLEVAQAYHTLWVDAKQICIDGSSGNPSSWTGDGVHPNNTGYAGYANGIYNSVLVTK